MSKIDDAWEITYRLVEIYFRGRKPPTPEELTRVARRIYEDLGTGREQERKAHQMSAESPLSRQEHIRSEYLKAHPRAKHSAEQPHQVADAGDYECPDCGRFFQTRRGLYAHQRWVHRPKVPETAASPDGFELKKPLDENQIKKLRHHLGLSVKDLAQILNVSYHSVYGWEKGKSKPRAAQQERLRLFWEVFGKPAGQNDAVKGKVRTQCDAEVIRLRESGLTLDAIGKIYGVSRERVRQWLMKSTVQQQIAMAPEEIKRLRSSRGMAQEQMATEVGVSVATVRRWERGITTPSPLAQSKLRQLIRKR